MEIKKYKAGDELFILELFKKVFNKEMSIEYWKWRFENNPFSNELMIHLMWEGDLLVGHYAVSPVDMIIHGTATKTALSMTTMTHPEYTGRGIFSQLSLSLYRELSEEHQYKFVWGFPNNNSHYAFIKNLKWKNLATIPMLSLKTINLQILERQIDIEQHFQFTESVSQKLSFSSKSFKIDKTVKYLNWRYLDNPSAEYKIFTTNGELGIVVYKIIPSFTVHNEFEIDIMEIKFNNSINILNDLICSIITTEKFKIEKINIWSSIFSEDYLVLEKFGFTAQLPITYLGYHALDQFDKSHGVYEEWDLNLGYSDVY